LEQAFSDKATIVGTVTGVIKGGFSVDVGVRAFMPASRSGVRDASEMEKLVGQEIRCRIIKRDATERLVTRARGSGLKSDVATDAFDRPVAIHGFIHTTTPLQDFGFLRTGQFKQADEPRLAASIQSAVVWTRDQFPVIAARTEGLTELKGRFAQQELVGRENRCNGKAKLRIVKLADRSAAQPGDIVTFTIRFDNIGDREVQDVVIVDDLTARLEYVDDSGTCDRKGVLFTQENEEGSLVLRWELDEPLPGQAGGVVTFQARVR
jgi:uncharacterized repeat protein (TIGR01451 family)